MKDRKKKRIEAARRAAERARNDELGRKLRERIAYHEAKLKEEQEERERPRRGLFIFRRTG